MSYAEFRQWVEYRRRRGSLNAGQRIEWAAAQLLCMAANRNASGAEYDPWDFAPHHDAPDMSLDEAMRKWG